MTDDEWLDRRRAVLEARRTIGFISTSSGSSQERSHGIASYRKGCRCGLCRSAHADAGKRYRARKKVA